MRITRRTRLFVALRAPLSENHYEPNDTGRFCCAARGVPTGKWISSATFRDLLIALEAEQAGATLVTEDARDFARWKSLLASARKTLKLFDASKTA